MSDQVYECFSLSTSLKKHPVQILRCYKLYFRPVRTLCTVETYLYSKYIFYFAKAARPDDFCRKENFPNICYINTFIQDSIEGERKDGN